MLPVARVMLMTGTQSIRDVIAFPKSQTANCLLTGAPTPVGDDQLRELGIRVQQVKKTKTSVIEERMNPDIS